MQRAYLIKFGGEKETHEMNALELNGINDAIDWIKGTMESDSEYFNCNIECNIYIQDVENCKALVYINADDKIGIKVGDDECSDIETIIETNLSIISKIIHKMK